MSPNDAPHALNITPGPGTALCECGCRKIEARSRMKFVEARNHVRTEDHGEHIGIRQRWFIRKSCEEFFLRELQMTTSLDQLCKKLEEAPWWCRIPSFFTLYEGWHYRMARIHGEAKARRAARQFALLVIAPEWLAARLTARWKRQKQQVGQGAAPTGMSGPLSVLPSAPN